MKRANNIVVAAIAGIGLLLLASSSQAQYKATGDDGITASPKYRQFLNEYKANHSAKPAAEISQMAFPKCKDQFVRKTDRSARGANKPSEIVASHLCKGCGTDWAVVGHGKSKESVATHKCDSCGAKTTACCSKTATKGMGK